MLSVRLVQILGLEIQGILHVFVYLDTKKPIRNQQNASNHSTEPSSIL